jgi:hypothetical protein
MMVQTAFRSEESFTQEEFLRFLNELPSSDINHYELLNGRIVMTPPAGWPRGEIGSTLAERIKAHVRSARLGRVQDSSAGFDLPSGDTIEPDLSFISPDRFVAGPNPERGKFLASCRISSSRFCRLLPRDTTRRRRRRSGACGGGNHVPQVPLVLEQRWLAAKFRQP